MLCLAARVPQTRVIGLEMQRDLVRLAGDNAILNCVEARVSAMNGDLLHAPPRLSPGTFDHVMANPPQLASGRATASPVPGKTEATVEGEADLANWVRFALSMARPKGSVTFVHRADRIDALLAEIAGRAGEVVVYPLWPAPGKPAVRILVRARKQIATPARLAPGLVLHEPGGQLTRAAEGVLREGRGLDL
jgi:tRNA1(Val) A37 N6-methylase TrmN6